MDEPPITDADCDYRAFACELAQWLFEGVSVHPADVGEGVSIQCGDDLTRFVRGE